MILVVGLLVAVRSSGTICRERERQTWDGLLLTPLEPYALVRGKLWGIIHSVRPYWLAYFIGAMVWAISNGPSAALITVLCWLASWPLLYYQAANGLYHSARANSSWQALVAALTSGMLALIECAGFAFVVLALFVLLFLWALVLWAATNLPSVTNPVVQTAFIAVAYASALAAICLRSFSGAERLLQEAEEYIARQDRIAQGARPDNSALAVPAVSS